MKGSVARTRSSKATPPGAGQGESQSQRPTAVKARLSRTTRVQIFCIPAFPQGILTWNDSIVQPDLIMSISVYLIVRYNHI